MAIFDDFVRFIDSQLTADSQVEVNFYEICLFCASVDEFFDNFMAGIELVENGTHRFQHRICLRRRI